MRKNNRKLSSNFNRKIVTLQCVVSGVAKQKMSPKYLCVKEAAENGEWSKEVTAHLNYATIKLLNENSRQQTKQFCYFYIYFSKSGNC